MEETGELLNFVTNVTGDRFTRIEEDLGNGYVRLNITEAERRQAKNDIQSVEDAVLELLRNSRDADASKIFMSFQKEADLLRKISIIDDGHGIPKAAQERIFESRVTTKLDTVNFDQYGIHGRGMALFSIKQSADDIRILHSVKEKGTSLRFIADTTKLNEKVNQFEIPEVEIIDGKPEVTRGVRNVLRVVTEFLINHPQLEIYMGIGGEILATMYTKSQSTVFESERSKNFGIACYNWERRNLKIWQLCGFASNAETLKEIANNYYGLELSNRHVNRIMCGEIKPVSPLSINEIMRKKVGLIPPKHSAKRKISVSENLSKYFNENDLQVLKESLNIIAEDIGNKYFLKLQKDPEIIREKNRLKILLPFEKDEII